MAKKKMDKLSQEVAQALAAGMSYGKWKAMQEPARIEPKKEQPGELITCPWCNTPFIPRRKNQKFCQLSCQQNYWQSKREVKYNAEYQRKYRERKKAEADGRI